MWDIGADCEVCLPSGPVIEDCKIIYKFPARNYYRAIQHGTNRTYITPDNNLLCPHWIDCGGDGACNQNDSKTPKCDLCPHKIKAMLDKQSARSRVK